MLYMNNTVDLCKNKLHGQCVRQSIELHIWLGWGGVGWGGWGVEKKPICMSI
jgi:hypothetical protein